MAGLGGKREGAGRPRGVPNAVTLQGRAAIAAFVEGNAGRLEGWLDAIAKDNPKAAFDAFMSVVEYHIPKLQRSEIINKNPYDNLKLDNANVMKLRQLMELEMERRIKLEQSKHSDKIACESNLIDQNAVVIEAELVSNINDAK